jgi:uncharacterized protein
MSFDTDEQAQAWLAQCDWDLMVKMPSWKKWLEMGLSDTVETIQPHMPNTMNAKYAEWKIWFEKYFQYIRNDKKLILLGHSLGGIFLVKYLSENTFPRKIDQLHLISPVYDNAGVSDESVATFAFDPENLPHITKQVRAIHIWHSEDDTIVPIDHSERYQKWLAGSELHRFKDRGHFIGNSHFVELFLEIQKVLS